MRLSIHKNTAPHSVRSPTYEGDLQAIARSRNTISYNNPPKQGYLYVNSYLDMFPDNTYATIVLNIFLYDVRGTIDAPPQIRGDGSATVISKLPISPITPDQ